MLVCLPTKKKLSGIPLECLTVLDPDHARRIVGPDLGPNYLKSYQQMAPEIKEFYGYSIVFTAYSCMQTNHRAS